VVRLLRENGFRTTDSGDGVTNVAAGMEGALPVPHVHCVVHDWHDVAPEAHRMMRLIAQLGLLGDQVTIEASYSPLDGVATISLYGLDDASLRSSGYLQRDELARAGVADIGEARMKAAMERGDAGAFANAPPPQLMDEVLHELAGDDCYAIGLLFPPPVDGVELHGYALDAKQARALGAKLQEWAGRCERGFADGTAT
jgi:hypothetical protein